MKQLTWLRIILLETDVYVYVWRTELLVVNAIKEEGKGANYSYY